MGRAIDAISVHIFVGIVFGVFGPFSLVCRILISDQCSGDRSKRCWLKTLAFVGNRNDISLGFKEYTYRSKTESRISKNRK